MAQGNGGVDPLDNAKRLGDLDEDRVLDGVVKRSGARINRDELDENATFEDEVQTGLRLADDEFDGVTTGLLGNDEEDPDLVQFDAEGNVIKKKPKKKKQEEGDEFADDEDEIDDDLDEEDL